MRIKSYECKKNIRLTILIVNYKLGSQNLPPLDPFNDISPMSDDGMSVLETNRFDLDPVELESYKRVTQEESDDEEWVNEDFERNAFDQFEQEDNEDDLVQNVWL